MSSVTSHSDSASLSSVDDGLERSLTHRISLINILDVTTSQLISDSDLDADQDEMMSQALRSNTKYDRSRRAQKLEQAIKTVSIKVIILNFVLVTRELKTSEIHLGRHIGC